MNRDTICVQSGWQPKKGEARVLPIFQSTTFKYETSDQMARLFDLEEAGLIGSAAYRKAHKAATENQVVLNLDCVGDGDSIIFFPSKKLKKDSVWMDHLRRCGGWFGNKHLSVHEKGYANYPSDHIRFPLSVGIGAFHKKNGKNPCLKRIHTVHDTVLDETNVNILRACISTLISMQ